MTGATQYPDKDFHTLQARAALVNVILHRCHDDRGRTVFIVSRWNLTRELPTLEAVDQWISRLEGKAVNT